MKAIFQSVFLAVAAATESELVKQIEFLKAENEILRSRLPKRIYTTRAERARMVKYAKQLGSKASQLVSLVSPRTLMRWLAEDRNPKQDRTEVKKHGRRKKPQEIRDLIVKFASENEGWGSGRILGELYRLGYKDIKRGTVCNILRENGFRPNPPGRDNNTWAEFLRRHKETLLACDFFTKSVWTPIGRLEYYILALTCPGTREVKILGMTPHPNEHWMIQQARNLCVVCDEFAVAPRYLIHDMDTKFCKKFLKTLRSGGLKTIKIPPRSPNMNAHCERFIGSIKRECLDRFLVFGENHLRHILTEYLDYYHHRRPHRGTGFLPPNFNEATREEVETLELGELVRHEQLGGVLSWYEQKAG